MSKKLSCIVVLFFCLTYAETIALLDITMEEKKNSHELILWLSEDPNYILTEVYKPPSLEIKLVGVSWWKDAFSQKTKNSSLYEFRVTTDIEKVITVVRLYFYHMPEYKISSPSNRVVITWPKIDHFPDPGHPVTPTTIFSQLVSLSFKEANLTDVIRLLSSQNNLNLVLGDDIEGVVTLSLESVTLQTALDAILKVSGYDWFIMENIIIIKPMETNLEGELKTKLYKLRFTGAGMIRNALMGVLTKRAVVIPFSSSHSLEKSFQDRIIITEKTANFPAIDRIINEIDQRQAQVNISVKFIEATLRAEERMGINWSMRSTINSPVFLDESGESQNTIFPENFNDLKIASLTIPTFAAIIELLANDNDARLLQEPQITTFNNSKATISVGTEIPVVVPQGEGSVFGTNPYTFEMQKIDISLDVLPRINTGGLITMEINASVAAIIGYAGPEADRPIVSKRVAKTSVMVRDGETLLIGGLIFENESRAVGKVPFLSRIPIIKALFRSKVNIVEQRELLIFITPTIIS